MAYIGRGVEIGMFEKQILTPDSTTTTFALTYAVGSANSLLVVYGGVTQEPQVAYSVSGGGQQIVFSEAPATGTTTYIIYLGKQLTTPRAAGQETTKQTFAGDGSTVTFTLTDPPVVPAGIMVFVDGILQREGSGNNYVSSGSTITFTSAPDSSAEIDVYTLVKEKVSIDTVADGSITVTKLAAGHPTWNGAGETVIATASSGNSLRITNTGSGNSLLVEDSASTDSTPFVITAAGDVGVGTASPSSKLEVAGALSLTSVALPAAGTARLYSRNTDNCLYIQTGSGNTLYLLEGSQNTMYAASPTLHSWAINNSEKMRLNSSGNVGIGTTSPAYKLEVVNAATTPAAAVFRTSGFADDNVSTVYLQDDTANAIGVGGRIAFRGLNDVGSYTSFATIQGAKENATTGNNAGAMIFKTQPNGGTLTERMRINSSGNVLVGQTSAGNGGNLAVYGSISIGTTTSGTQSSMAKDTTQLTASVSTSATTIYTDISSGMSSASAGYFIIYGHNNSGAGFMDVVVASSNRSAVVVSSSTVEGSPPARTYSVSSFALRLAMASGTFNINLKATVIGFPF